MNKKDYGLRIAISLLGVGILSIFFPFNILDGRSWGEYQINIGNYSELGEFISGVTAPFLSASAFILLYKTYKSQKKELQENQKILKTQNDVISKQQFENTFFNLLDVYNKTVIQMEIKGTRTSSKNGIKTETDISKQGRASFKPIYDTFRIKYQEMNLIIRDISTREKIHIIYNEFYSGFDASLGHYFRILYHILQYVDSSNIVDKKDYTNILRAQLSNYETLLLCFNTLSNDYQFMNLIEKYGILKHIHNNDELLRYECKDIISKEAFDVK